MASRGRTGWDGWDCCEHDGCDGVRLPSGGRCWAHATEQDLDTALQQLATDRHLDARGVTLTGKLVTSILDALRDDDGQVVVDTADLRSATFQDSVGWDSVTFNHAWFNMATFRGDARFGGAIFQSHADFTGANFHGSPWFVGTTFRCNAQLWAYFHRDARFDRATFHDDAHFTGAIFGGGAEFRWATFQRRAWFEAAAFDRDACFDGATFHGAAHFSGATFDEGASFWEATFHDDAFFDKPTNYDGDIHVRGVTFQGDAQFAQAAFHNQAVFDGATFNRDARFRRAIFENVPTFGQVRIRRSADFSGATFERGGQLGPLLARRNVVLDDTVFGDTTVIAASAAALCCRRARFPAGVQLQLRWAHIVLDDANLAAPSILSGVPPFRDLEERRWAQAMTRLHATGDRSGRPRLVSVRRADVAGLTIASVDMRSCRFTHAHHLDQLKLDEADFAPAPPNWRWTARKTIAEEHHWRHTRQRPPTTADNPPDGRRWYQRAQQPPDWLQVETPTPAQIAGIYRSLRKAREDTKDEPGAADFYYGEMEMRRHDATTSLAERIILTLYWLVSGYGLRASRALAWLTGVLLLATIGLAAVGLEQPSGSFPSRLGSAALVALEGAAFRTSPHELTYKGNLIYVLLRFAGPVLLALAAISIRGRVKR